MKKAKFKEISNTEELKDFILNNDLTQNDIEVLLKATINVWLIYLYESKKELIKAIDVYWNKYGSDELRPLWLDLGEKEFQIEMMYRHEESEYYYDEKEKEKIMN